MDRDDERIHRKEEEISTEKTNYGQAILGLILVIGLITIFAKGTTYNWSVKEFLTGMAAKTNDLIPMNEILNFDRSIKAIQQGQQSFNQMTNVFDGTMNGFFKSVGEFFTGIYNFFILFEFNLTLDLFNVLISLGQNVVILFQILTLTY